MSHMCVAILGTKVLSLYMYVYAMNVVLKKASFVCDILQLYKNLLQVEHHPRAQQTIQVLLCLT